MSLLHFNSRNLTPHSNLISDLISAFFHLGLGDVGGGGGGGGG